MICQNDFLYDKAFTHGGVFHADDVFAAAMLRIIKPGIIIERGNTVPEDYDGLVFDIGFGEFDHHQKDKRVRENGVYYAAFGLLWEKYGSMLMNEEDAKAFDESFVQPIDNSDNTGEKHQLSSIISDYNPVWGDETESFDSMFEKAVDFAKGILMRKIMHKNANNKAREMVKSLVENTSGNILIMEKSAPWKEAVKNTDILYVVFPSARGGYIVQAVPDDEDKALLKKPFPEEWRGLETEELRKVSGIETLNFCHATGFLCAVGEYEDAVKIAEIALKA